MAPLDTNWAQVMASAYVVVGIVKRSDFDLIDLPAHDHGATDPNRPVITKKAKDPSGVQVVFQHWYGPTPAERAAEAEAAEALSRAATLSARRKGAVEREWARIEAQFDGALKGHRA